MFFAQCCNVGVLVCKDCDRGGYSGSIIVGGSIIKHVIEVIDIVSLK